MNRYKNNYPMYKGFELNYPDYYSQQSIYLPSGLQVPDMDDEGFDEADIEYMKSLYPDICKRMQAYIDEECDRLEYDGSYMYDEYPDREAIERITDRINEQLNRDELRGQSEEVEAEQFTRNTNLQRDLIKILFLNELFNRRRRRNMDPRYRYRDNRYRDNRNRRDMYNYRRYFY